MEDTRFPHLFSIDKREKEFVFGRGRAGEIEKKTKLIEIREKNEMILKKKKKKTEGGGKQTRDSKDMKESKQTKLSI